MHRQLHVHHIRVEVNSIVEFGGMNICIVDFGATTKETLGIRILAQTLSPEEFSCYS